MEGQRIWHSLLRHNAMLINCLSLPIMVNAVYELASPWMTLFSNDFPTIAEDLQQCGGLDCVYLLLEMVWDGN